jgi:Superinfection immunity protein
VTAAAGSSAGSAGAVLLTLVWVVLLALAYFVPVIVARVRRVSGFAQVVVVNVFLGWTAVGWVVALVMALRPSRAQEERAARYQP